MAQNAWVGATAGAVGGLIGSAMMVVFQHLIGGSNDRGDRSPHHRTAATPNETDGTYPDEPGSIQAAEQLSRTVAGYEPSEREKQVGGSILHYAFGAATGALYGAATAVQPRTAVAAGLPLGAAVWLVADEIGMQAAGFARKPTDYAASRHAAALGSHLVFGLTVECVRRALAGAPRQR